MKSFTGKKWDANEHQNARLVSITVSQFLNSTTSSESEIGKIMALRVPIKVFQRDMRTARQRMKNCDALENVPLFTHIFSLSHSSAWRNDDGDVEKERKGWKCVYRVSRFSRWKLNHAACVSFPSKMKYWASFFGFARFSEKKVLFEYRDSHFIIYAWFVNEKKIFKELF